MSGGLTHEQARAAIEAVKQVLGEEINVALVVAIPDLAEGGIFLEIIANVPEEHQVRLLEAAIEQLQGTEDETSELFLETTTKQ